MGNKPDFRVYVTQQAKAQGQAPTNFYKEVGVAWHVAKGGISVQLLAVPVDGKLVMFPPREDDNADPPPY